MTLFPASFFEILVYGAIVLTALGAITLLVLFARDFGRKELW